MVDILVLGGTGFTGKLVLQYLASHAERARFTLGVSVRSRAKGDALLAELLLDAAQIELFVLDVTDTDQVDAAVGRANVVLNTVGPFWLYSTPVIKSCARQGKGYVDITGETVWLFTILKEVDTLASKTGAIIVPACGLDSIPSDIATFLSVQTLRHYCETEKIPWPGVADSVTGFYGELKPSGGSLSTLLMWFSSIPRSLMRAAHQSYALSPIKGKHPRAGKVLVRSPVPKFAYGTVSLLAPCNAAIVHRSWGLFALQDAGLVTAGYGEEFHYEEYMLARDLISAVAAASMIALSVLLFLPPVRWMYRWLLPAGTGPTMEWMKNAKFQIINHTRMSGSAVAAQTTFNFCADPGYLTTSAMVAESALALLLDRDRLSPLAKKGGMLTPASAFGDVVVERLNKTGYVDITTELLANEKN